MRLWLRMLSAVAPRAAGRVGARLWFRVQRPAIRPEARAFLATGERFETRTKDSVVVRWRWGSGPTVLLMHGWGGYGAQMQPFVEPLVRSGHRVVLFDAPSHGVSGPSALGPKSATLFDSTRRTRPFARRTIATPFSLRHRARPYVRCRKARTLTPGPAAMMVT